MLIRLTNTGRRYNSEWIFRHFNGEFQPGSKTAILGHNGSGKSTLLKVISGSLTPSEGKTEFLLNNGIAIPREKKYLEISLTGPYLDVPAELTGPELFSYHAGFREMLVPAIHAMEISGLGHAAGKKISSYSSGMRQRLKLALAILTRSEVLLIDEPNTNLDKGGMNWYREMMMKYAGERTVFVCSNHQPDEYFFCTREIDITDYKKSVR